MVRRGLAAAFAQGQCGGARAGTPECDPTPAKLPFEPTGWKTVLLDHFSCQVADYPKEAAYYAALMNWKIRSDDGKQAVLDIGDWGGLVLRGGYRRRRRPRPSRRGARRPGAGGGGGGPRPPRHAVFDGFCWGIDPWDAKTGGGGAAASAGSRRWPTTTARLPELPREGSRTASTCRSATATARTGARDRPAARRRRRRRSNPRTGRRCGSITSRSRCRTTRRPWRSTRAPRLEAGKRRGQPEPVRDRRRRRHHHPPRRPRAGGAAADDAGGAPSGDGPHLVRHHAVRSRTR